MELKNNENLFKAHGLKNTRARKALLEALEKADKPISAEELYIMLHEAGAAANLSTVYRTLELMESKGLVAKTLLNDSKAHYEFLGAEHRHLIICIRCHKTAPIENCPLSSLERDVGKKTSYEITGHRLELYGVCPECKNE